MNPFVRRDGFMRVPEILLHPRFDHDQLNRPVAEHLVPRQQRDAPVHFMVERLSFVRLADADQIELLHLADRLHLAPRVRVADPIDRRPYLFAGRSRPQRPSPRSRQKPPSRHRLNPIVIHRARILPFRSRTEPTAITTPAARSADLGFEVRSLSRPRADTPSESGHAPS